MRIFFCIILFFLCKTFVRSQALIAITHVNIIDVKNEKVIYNKTVLINGDRIERITTNSQVPANTKVIQAKNMFLIPGLWDMHYHNMDDESTQSTDSAVTPMLIANGITGTRDMCGFNVTLQRREAIRKGKIIAPETFVGALVDGPIPARPLLATAVSDTVRAVFIVDSLKKAGYDFIKVYAFLPRPIYFAIAATCKQLKIPFEGHVPVKITPLEAALAGQKSQEHQIGIILQCSSKRDSLQNEYMDLEHNMLLTAGKEINAKSLVLSNTFDTAQLNNVAKIFTQTGTWYCPTLITYANLLLGAKKPLPWINKDRLLQYAIKSAIADWKNFTNMHKNYTKEDWDVKSKRFYLLKIIVKKLYDKNVNILAGDDNGAPYCFPGFALHQEMQMLVSCGLSDADVLKIATYNPAVFFNIEDRAGSVEEGKTANLVLLNANPLNKINNTEKINAVFIKGKYFDRDALDKLLIDVKEYCKKH